MVCIDLVFLFGWAIIFLLPSFFCGMRCRCYVLSGIIPAQFRSTLPISASDLPSFPASASMIDRVPQRFRGSTLYSFLRFE